MSLRPLVEIAAENERVHALAARVRAAADGGRRRRCGPRRCCGRCCWRRCSRTTAASPGRPALLVSADDRSARDLAADLRAYLAPRRVRFYPSRGTGYASHVTPPPHLVGLRIDALDALGREADAVVVASATALAEAVPDASLRPAGFAIAKGEEIELGAVAADLVAAGYERVEQVEERGQFAVRGGILDVYPATEERAVRIELFGDEIDSMRWFSTFTQRSLGEAERVELAPAAELDAEHRELAELAALEAAEEGERPSNLAELLPLEHFRAPLELVPESAAVVLAAAEEIEPALRDHWEDATAAMHADDAQHLYVDVAAPLAERAALSLTGAGEDDEDAFRAARAESPARSVKEAEGELEKLVRSGYRTVVAFDSRGEAERARYGLDRLDARLLEGGRLSPEPGLSFAEARLREGFVSPELKLAVYPFRRLVHRRRGEEPAPGAGRGRLAFGELRVGDHVVHEDHGVARFAGFETREVGGVTRDYLYLEYKGEDRVYVPTDQLAKLSRYVGAGGEPSLSALGGKRWQNMKARARKAAGALAGRAAQPLRRAPLPQGPPLPARRRVADRDGERLPLPRDRRPGGGDRGRQGRHGIGAADGPAGLRRRRLRQDRGGAAGRGQGRRRRQAGDGPGADHDPRPAALRDLPRAPRRPPVPGRGRLAPAPRGRGESGAEGLRGGQGRRPDRHPPAALARRPRQGAGPGRGRRGAALRGQAEGAAAAAEAEGRRAGALGDADPAHPADEPGRAARHLGDRDPARGAAPGPHLRRPLRRGPGRQGDPARDRAPGAGLRPPQPDRLAARGDRAAAGAGPRRALRRSPRPDGRARARGDDAHASCAARPTAW